VPVKTAPPPSTAPQAPQPQPPVRPRRREPWYWSLCLVIVILVNIRCLTVLHRAESAVQEAAIAATAAWWTVAAYVVTRCVEGLHWRNPPQ